MTVRGGAQIRGRHPCGRERFAQPGPAGPVVGVDLWVRAHASVEQQHSLGVVDDVAETRLHPWMARAGLLRCPREVAEINTPHRDIRHAAILADLRPGPDQDRGSRNQVLAWLMIHANRAGPAAVQTNFLSQNERCNFLFRVVYT